jgi:hypothetical protein
MNICGKNELMSLISQLGTYREKIGGIIATACTKKNTSFKTNKYGNYYDSYRKGSESHSCVASNKVATSMYKREIRNRRKHVRLRDEEYT